MLVTYAKCWLWTYIDSAKAFVRKLHASGVSEVLFHLQRMYRLYRRSAHYHAPPWSWRLRLLRHVTLCHSMCIVAPRLRTSMSPVASEHMFFTFSLFLEVGTLCWGPSQGVCIIYRLLPNAITSALITSGGHHHGTQWFYHVHRCELISRWISSGP